jgi:hypothetical protein
MKLKEALLSFAILVGLFLGGLWAFRFLGRLGDNIYYWIRYNGIYAIAAVGILALIWYLLFDKKS